MKNVLLLLSATLFLIACDESADYKQSMQQEAITMDATNAVGMPAVPNHWERKQLKMIYELRDKAIPTITYTQDMNGKLHKLCDSIGFGIPYATQFTNPQHIDPSNSHFVVLPQADPNSLYSPSNAEGTWILCISPETKEMSPLYVEPRVVVSPFQLKSVD